MKGEKDMTSNRKQLVIRVAALAAFAALAVLAAGRARASETAVRNVQAAHATIPGKWCSGERIRYFAGGSPGDGFAPILALGAQTAARDLGAKVDIIFSKWEVETMLSQLRTSIAAKPDGIAMMGHPGDTALAPLAAKVRAAKIAVVYQNVDVPQVRAKYGGGFVGANLKEQGAALAQKALRVLPLKRGDRVTVFGPWGQPGRYLREGATADTLKAAGLKVDRLNLPLEATTDPNVLTPIISAQLLRHKDTRMIVYPGTMLGSAPQYMRAAGKKPGQVFNIGFDFTPAILNAFERGYVQLTADQQPFLQGYMPILSLCLTLKYKFAPLNLDTGASFTDKSGFGSVAALVKRGIR